METSCTLTPTTLTVAQKETLQKFIEMLPKLFEHEEIISLYGSKVVFVHYYSLVFFFFLILCVLFFFCFVFCLVFVWFFFLD